MTLQSAQEVWQEFLINLVNFFELSSLGKQDAAIARATSTRKSAVVVDEVVERPELSKF